MSSNTGPTPGDIFDVKKVRKFIELMNEHDLAEIDLKQGDQRIRLRRPEAVTMSAMPAMPISAAPSVSTGGEPKAGQPVADESKFLVIKSPMVGTFYAAANPESPPFVKVGDRVGPDTTVCIVAAWSTPIFSSAADRSCRSTARLRSVPSMPRTPASSCFSDRSPAA